MKLSLFSVSYAGYWGQHRLDLPQFLSRAASLGFDGVMLAGKRPHLSPLDYDAERLELLRKVLQDHSIECYAVAGYNDFAHTAAAEVPYREIQVQYLESLCRAAASLGAPLVRVFTAYELPTANPQSLWADTVSVLQELGDRAASHGVTLALQNHHDLGVHTEALLELLSDVDRPNCKLGFDAWSPALRGEDLYESAKAAAPFTAMTTNADYIRLPRFRYRPELVNYVPLQPDGVRAVRFGDGFIDYRAFFQGLKDGGFNGPCHYEMCSPVRGGGSAENLNQYSTHYLSWMRENFV